MQEPEGPIRILRYNPSKGETLKEAKSTGISAQMIGRLANAIVDGKPFNVDRVLGASYSTRSVLESLIAQTPNFYSCKPTRIEKSATGSVEKVSHKHLIYLPNEVHELGVLGFKDVNIVISELGVDAVYQDFSLDGTTNSNSGMTIQQERRHAQMQIALVLIGRQLGFRTWVASNDRSIRYEGRMISQYDEVIDNLSSERVLNAYPEAVQSAKLIDCIWFRNGRLMPAVMEVEHSTGVTSGLARMKGFYDLAPPLRDIHWTIIAPDEDRKKVVDQANREQFKDLKTKFFPYSAVEELYSLCERRKPKGITDEFLDCFMEDCVVPN